MTQPKTDISMTAGSIPVRVTSSAAAVLARSTTSMFWKSVPDLTNGVRQPSTIATRPPGPRISRRPVDSTLGFLRDPVHTVSARSVIS